MDYGALLTSLGFPGSFVVHHAPHLIHIDWRAHHVFVGFDLEVVKEKVARSFAGSSNPTPELIQENGLIFLPRKDSENPGGLLGVHWLVDRLLGPGGCPWDQAQTHQTLTRHLLEEAYELIEAIDNHDLVGMNEEIGDVLLQPVMHAQMQQRDGSFGIEEVSNQLVHKLVTRHPHVFGDVEANDAETVLKNWDKIKAEQKGVSRASVLDGVPSAMPALSRALEVSKRAVRVGFEWPDIEGIKQKLHEELNELEQAQTDQERTDELGDILFTVVNIARWLKIDPEGALRQMTNRFCHRFVTMESLSSKPLNELSLDEWDDLWNQAKAGS